MWKILKTQDQWIYKWDNCNNSILVSNLIYIWGKSYTDAEIIDQIPSNFKSNSLDQIKDLLCQLLSSSEFNPEENTLTHLSESTDQLNFRGELPFSHFVFSWTFTVPRLDQSQFYKHLTLPLLQILQCSNSLISNEAKLYSSLGKSQKHPVSVFEADIVANAFKRLNQSKPPAVVHIAHAPHESISQDYQENLKKALSKKKKRKSLFS
jgi:hypothetical protein